MGSYFYSICAGGIICGLAKRLTGEKYRDIMNFLCSLFIITTVLQPVKSMKGMSFDFENSLDNKTEEMLSVIYSDELETKLNTLLEDNAYNARVENIYCECKDGEIKMLKLLYSGDVSAGGYLSEITGMSQDRVLYSG